MTSDQSDHIVDGKSVSSIAQCIHASIRCRVSHQLMFPALSSVQCPQCPPPTQHNPQPIIRNYSRKFFRVIFMGKGLKCLQRPAFTAFFSGLLHNRLIHLSFTIIKLK